MKRRERTSPRRSSAGTTLLSIAIAKGYLFEPAIELLQKVGVRVKVPAEIDRELTFQDQDKRFKFFVVRPADVPVYVEQGAADLGIVGKDILEEQSSAMVELLDLGFGGCQLVLAALKASKIKSARDLGNDSRIATKFPTLTEKYFSRLEKRVEIVKLYGSVELAPSVRMADAIVDLTATGQTLRQLNLQVIDVLLESTARLIANRVQYKIKYEEIWELCSELSGKTTPKKKSKRS